MARRFKRTRQGVRGKLDDDERGLLAHLFVEVFELLDDGEPADADVDPLAALVGIGTTTQPPQDPAVARLLPDAHRSDPDASADFRRYTETGLRERKRAGLEMARQTLGRPGALVLSEAESQAWVVALTDVRLVLASRLGVESDEDLERVSAQVQAEPDAVAPAGEAGVSAGANAEPGGLAFLLAVYEFLTWLQESLVEALLQSLPD